MEGGVDSWFMMQRYRHQELRKRRQEAEQLLHGFRGYYDESFSAWSPRKERRHRSSFGLGYGMDDSLTDPDVLERRQTTMPRLQHEWGNNDEGNRRYSEHFEPNPLDPNRTEFLNDRQHFDGTQYPRTSQDMEVSNAVKLFSEETADDIERHGLAYNPHKGRYYTDSCFDSEQLNGRIDISGSEERLRQMYGGPRSRSYVDGTRVKAYMQERQGVTESRGTGFAETRDGPLKVDILHEPETIPEKIWLDYLNDDEVEPSRPLEKGGPRSGSYVDGTLAGVYVQERQGDVESRDASFGETRDGPPRIEKLPETEQMPTVWRDFISDEQGARFPPEKGRYHLYASYACPGSHRALIVRALKGLEDVVSVTIVHPTWRHTRNDDPGDKHRGWIFGDPNGKPFHNTMGRGGPFPPAYPGNDPDPIMNAYSVRELYEHAKDTSEKYTVPLLWDKKLNTIVNNESSDISYMLNSCLNEFSKNPNLDLYTEDDEDGLDRLNDVSQWLYPMMIHGVYRCGFARTQAAYDRAITELTGKYTSCAAPVTKQDGQIS